MSNTNSSVKVFLSEVSEEMMPTRKNLGKILESAGMELILPDIDKGEYKDNLLRNTIINKIQRADCTIHILGHSYGKMIKSLKEVSISEFQFNVAQRYRKENIISKIFVWYPKDLLKNPLESTQEKFINSIQNNITSNMLYSNNDSPVAFVEDLRSIMLSERKEEKNVSETDIFFVYNELDKDEASNILELVDDIADVKELAIIQNSTEDYLTFIADQMAKTKLLVIYYNRTSEWAIPFVQKIWNKTGGASSSTQILLIGDSEIESNQDKIVSIPKVISLVISSELIPLEIKVQLDKLNENINKNTE